MRILVHGHFASYDAWVKWFVRQGFNPRKSVWIVNLLIRNGILLFIRGRIRSGYYPYNVWENRGFRICERIHLNIYWENSIYGHLIYKPLKKVKFKFGVRTLKQYLKAVGKKEEDMKRDNHPLALEVYVIYNCDEKLKLGGIIARKIINEVIREIQSEGFAFSEKDFVFGIEYSVVIYRRKKEGIVEAVKRWTRNGEEWKEEDIKKRIRI